MSRSPSPPHCLLWLPADLGQLVTLVTLGAPNHFPHYMPHLPWTALFTSSAARKQTDLAAAAAALAAAAVPRVDIAAGAGDQSLPLTHAAASTPPPPGAGLELGLGLLMGDMPAVWTTSNHKVRWQAGAC